MTVIGRQCQSKELRKSLTHVLVLFVLLALPIISHFMVSQLRSHSNDKLKERAYWKIYFWYILITVLILLKSPFQTLYHSQHTFTLPWYLNALLWLILAYQAFTLLAPMILIRFSKKLQQSVADEYAKKSFIFPRTKRHLNMFVILAFIVGNCEEIIFRGFLFNYANDWGLSAGLSFLLVSIIFGLGHWQQGVSGIVESFLLGITMGFLYNLTGSLLIPIIWHIVYDLKVVVITKVLQKKK
jgi:membrane protease YdiL (CAAX protease family)